MSQIPPTDPKREERIDYEIVIDAYDEEERAMGWFYYVADECTYPYQARCIAERSISPLKKGEEIEVFGIASEEECEKEIFVMVRWQDRELAVPLSILEPIDANEQTKQAVEDWHYWVGRGYQF